MSEQTNRPDVHDPWAGATHLVIDLETLGQGPRARVASIGAVRFRLDCQNAVCEASAFHRLVDLYRGANAFRDVDPKTLEWWDQQSREARFTLDGGPRVGLALALQEFVAWAVPAGEDPKALLAWGYGDEFDLAILADACGQLAAAYRDDHDQEKPVALPWDYWRGHNLRTLSQCFPHIPSGRHGGVKHNALADAQFEAQFLVRLLHERATWLDVCQRAQRAGLVAAPDVSLGQLVVDHLQLDAAWPDGLERAA